MTQKTLFRESNPTWHQRKGMRGKSPKLDAGWWIADDTGGFLSYIGPMKTEKEARDLLELRSSNGAKGTVFKSEGNRESNPGRRSIHTAKWDDCVREVGGSARSAAAVCTSALGYRGSIKAGHRRRNPGEGERFMNPVASHSRIWALSKKWIGARPSTDIYPSSPLIKEMRDAILREKRAAERGIIKVTPGKITEMRSELSEVSRYMRKSNPSDHSIPRAHRVYEIANRHEATFSRELKRVYGPKIASEMRYHPSQYKDKAGHRRRNPSEHQKYDLYVDGEHRGVNNSKTVEDARRAFKRMLPMYDYENKERVKVVRRSDPWQTTMDRVRKGNPSDHSIPRAHRAYYIAQRADDAYSRELARVYGKKVAGEMRYHPSDFKDKRLILARKRFERALKVLHSVWDQNRDRGTNPLPAVKSITMHSRPIYYVVQAAHGNDSYFLRRNGKLARGIANAARFHTTREAIDKAKAHLAKYAASRKFRFKIKLAY